MAAKLGIDAKLYINTAGTYGSPTWVEVTCVKDFKLSYKWNTTDAPSRANRVGEKAKLTIDISGSGSLKASDTDAQYLAIWNALVGNTTNLDVLILNGAKDNNGSRGVRYDALVVTGDEDQGIGNAIYTDIEVVPDAFKTNPPKYCVVTAGSPVYTAF